MGKPSGRTASKYAFLLGEHISHSLSPAIHNPAYAALGLDYEFGLMDVPPSRLHDALARMREHGVRRLPVLDDAGHLSGIVAVDNLLEALAEQLDAVVRVLKAEQTRETATRK